MSPKKIKKIRKKMSSKEVSSEADVLSENDETDIKSFINEADGNLKQLNFHMKDDEVTKYCNEYLEKEMYKGNGPIPVVDNSSSDDLETVIEDSKAEETYNFRFEEKGSDKIMTHPRKVAGEQREKISAKMEERKKKEEENEQFNREMDEVDEKWHKIYIDKGNNFTPEQLTQYNSEVADVIMKYQGEEFKYVNTGKVSNIRESIQIMEEEDEEEDFDNEEEEGLDHMNQTQKEKKVKEAEKELKKLTKEDNGEEESGDDSEEDADESGNKKGEDTSGNARGDHNGYWVFCQLKQENGEWKVVRTCNQIPPIPVESP